MWFELANTLSRLTYVLGLRRILCDDVGFVMLESRIVDVVKRNIDMAVEHRVAIHVQKNRRSFKLGLALEIELAWD